MEPPQEVERLLQEVAARWGLVISKDDPIIGAVALNDVVLNQHMGRLQEALEKQRKELAAQNDLQIKTSKQIAKTIMGEALATAKNEIDNTSALALKRTEKAAVDQLQAIGAALDDRTTLRRQLAWAWASAGVLGVLLVLVLTISLA